MQVIVLAAGHGHQLDGYNKLLIRDPFSDKTIIEQFIDIFKEENLKIVVGYRAINVMNRYPNLEYVYNSNWSHTNNSYSLGLALNTEPSLVVSSDIIFDPKLLRLLDQYENAVVTSNTVSRTLTSLNCSVKGDRIDEIYQGSLRNQDNPEAVGIYKVSCKDILSIWKNNCLKFTNLFAGQNLPLNGEKNIYNINVDGFRFDEINTPLDYMRLLNRKRDQH